MIHACMITLKQNASLADKLDMLSNPPPIYLSLSPLSFACLDGGPDPINAGYLSSVTQDGK